MQIEFSGERVRSRQEDIRAVAAEEGVSLPELESFVGTGKAVLLSSAGSPRKVVGIGKGLRTKVNASIGTSPDRVDLDMELEKARTAEKWGADTLMELSTGGDFDEIRRAVLDVTSLPVGSVPLYQACIETIRKHGSIKKMTPGLLFDTIEKQLSDGIRFMAIHTGVNSVTLDCLEKQNWRHGGIVSRGGAFMIAWMKFNGRENPLYSEFDRLIHLFKKYDGVLSLGNGMRAGAVHDSTDPAQVQELIINSQLAVRAVQEGVQTIVEGPGHIPMDEIEANVILQKRLSGDLPFYMLGPLVSDIGMGYDHIVAAVGAALSSAYGADFICYVTRTEHLALPEPDHVKEGVIAARIAAHIGDMVKLKRRERDFKVAQARKTLDWSAIFKHSLIPEPAMEIRRRSIPREKETCTMCGEFCAIKIANQVVSGTPIRCSHFAEP